VHDVIVIGAGPAGSATAHFLRQRTGADVLLLDRAAFPRDKTCGDGLTPRALRVLARMGILAQVETRGCPVEAYEVVAPNRKMTRAPITADHGALVVPRLTLDEIILDRAATSGARFEAPVRVDRIEPTRTAVRVHTRTGQAFEGRLAVLATGAATTVLNRSGILKRRPQAMLAARAYFEDVQSEVARAFQLRFDDAPTRGYGWVFPVARHAANIGVCFLPGPRRSETAALGYDRFIHNPALGPILRGGRQTGPLKGYPIRVDFLSAPTYGDRTLLVGEAAGLVNPLTGEGIDYALESGMLAADHIARGLDAGFSRAWLADYDRQLRARFERLFGFSEWIRDWYCKPLILNLLVPLANRRPELRQLLANVVLGERELRRHRPATMLARLLIYLARHP
jgi:menaquinone-9 beta-reductase